MCTASGVRGARRDTRWQTHFRFALHDDRRQTRFDMSEAQLEELSYETCLVLLRSQQVGRIAVIEHDFPVVLPIHFKLVEMSGPCWFVIRNRPWTVLATDSENVAP